MPVSIRHFRGYIFFFALWGVQLLSAQCSYDNQLVLQPLQSYYIPLEVTGALNNDLADPAQGVCGVLLEFEHDQEGSLTVELISPSGQRVLLMGPAFNSPLTSFSDWDIGFVPCGDPAVPDPGFSPQWTNLDPWGILSSYVGSYHPNTGCLEDFNLGAVNGTWTLHITCNNPFYAGTLFNFTLIFCDPLGLDCVTCEAQAGTFAQDSVLLCEGEEIDPALFVPQFSGIPPDVDEYGYLLLLSQNGILIDTASVFDFVLSPGAYQVCGLSYRLDGVDSLPEIGDLIFLINQDLLSQDPSFCGDLSDDCLDLIIGAEAPLTLLQAFICQGDSVAFGGGYLHASGAYYDTLATGLGCDSVIRMQLFVLQADFDILAPDLLGCGVNEVLLDTAVIAIFPQSADQDWEWQDADHGFLSSANPFAVQQPGWYYGQLTLSYGQAVCPFLDSVEVLEAPPLADTFAISGADTLCQLEAAWYAVTKTVSLGLDWQLGGGAEVLAQQGDSILLSWPLAGNYTLCASIFSACESVDTCIQVEVKAMQQAYAGVDTLICTSQLMLSGSAAGYWSSGQGAVFSDPADPLARLDLPAPGTYEIIRADAADCIFADTAYIRYLDEIEANILLPDSVCQGEKMILQIELPEGAAFNVWISYGGNALLVPDARNPASTEIQLPSSGWIYLDSIALAGNALCRSYLVDSFYVFVSSPASALVNGLDSVCSNSQDPAENILDFRTLLISGDLSGSFSKDPDLNLPGFPQQADFSGVAPGVYVFEYQTGAAMAPCPDSSYLILIEVKDCDCPPWDQLGDISLCNSDSLFPLPKPAPGEIPGQWILRESPVGDPATLEGSTLKTQGKAAGNYVLVYQAEQPFPLACRDSNVLIVHIFEAPSAGTVSDPQPICQGTDTIVALSTFLQNADPGGLWTEDPANPAALLQGDSAYVGAGVAEGVYLFYYIVNPVEGPCEADTANITLRILPPLSVEIAGDTLLNCDQRPTILKALASGQNLVYQWYDPEGAQIPGADADSLSVVQEGWYRVQLSAGPTCFALDSIYVSPNSNPVTGMVLEVLQPVCSGSPRGAVIVREVEGGSPGYLFSLDGGPFLALDSFPFLVPGTHQIEVRDSKGCSWLDSARIDVQGTIAADIKGRIYLQRGERTALTLVVDIPMDSIALIEWLREDVPDCVGCKVLDAQPDKTTVYQVWVTALNGCKAYAEIRIYVDQDLPVFVPDAFSPNDDGNNERILVYAHSDVNLIKRWLIFDRWGDQVFGVENAVPNDPAFGWDGKLKGAPMNPATFVYLLEGQFINGQTFIRKGTFVLIR